MKSRVHHGEGIREWRTVWNTDIALAKCEPVLGAEFEVFKVHVDAESDLKARIPGLEFEDSVIDYFGFRSQVECGVRATKDVPAMVVNPICFELELEREYNE